MDPAARRRKKIREALRLRDLSPAETIRAGARLIQAAHRVAEAGDRAGR